MNKKDRLELAKWAIKAAQEYGASDSAVNISKRRNVSVDYRESKIENLEEATSNSLSISLYVNGRYSNQSTNDLRKESLDKFIKEAVETTEYLAKDPFRKLPDPKYYPETINDDLKLTDPAYRNVNTDERIKIAKEIEEAGRGISDKIISVETGYSDTYYQLTKVHSNGFEGEYDSTYFSASASASGLDDNGGRPEDGLYCTARFKADLMSPEELGKGAVDRVLRKLGQSKIESGKYKLVVENRSCGRLIGMLRGAMTGYSLQQKSTFLDGMIDKKVGSDKLSFIDDPTIPKGLGSRPFDGEGMKAVKRTMIEDGVLRNFYIDTYYGNKLGMEPTTGSTTNLLFKYGNRSLDEIVKDLDRGILVTSFIGGNNNSTTGDFSYGIAGFLVENGEIVKPINEMNLSGNQKDFWNRLVETGSDPYIYSSWRMPTLVFDDADLSGI